MANSIQEMCTGPDFAVGEVYGLRQWYVSLAAGDPQQLSSLADWPFGAGASAIMPDADLSLRGHNSKYWSPAADAPNGHRMECFARSHNIAASFTVTREMFLEMFKHYAATGQSPDKRHFASALSTFMVNHPVVREAIFSGVGWVNEPGSYYHRYILPDIWKVWDAREIVSVKGDSAVGLVLRLLERALVEIPYFDGRPASDLTVLDAARAASADLFNVEVSDAYFRDIFEGLYAKLHSPVTVDIELNVPYPLVHDAPDRLMPNCTCGFYAYTDLKSLNANSNRAYLSSFNEMFSTSSSACVFGLIKGYGATVIGTKGFRTSRAEIVALTMPMYSAGRESWAPTAFDFEPTKSSPFYRTTHVDQYDRDHSAWALNFSADQVRDRLAPFTTSGRVFDNLFKLHAFARSNYGFGSVQ